MVWHGYTSILSHYFYICNENHSCDGDTNRLEINNFSNSRNVMTISPSNYIILRIIRSVNDSMFKIL